MTPALHHPHGNPPPCEDLVSEPLEPLLDLPAAQPPVAGEPVLPGAFRWRGRVLAIAAVLDSWKESGPCTHGSGERYLRKHWYHVSINTGETMTLYFERRARSPRERLQRWWLYSMSPTALDRPRL